MNRGGSWNNTARNCRVSNRNNNTPTNTNNNLGFRLAQLAPPCQKEVEQGTHPVRNSPMEILFGKTLLVGLP
ncbi:MAG: hypothetical protein IJT97_03845 [Bacteroidaceae bacterium]|nr:hypothetical protein [Bacteroidaceae bacterium]